MFLREMTDIRRMYNPKLMVVLEPKISGDRAT